MEKISGNFSLWFDINIPDLGEQFGIRFNYMVG